MGAVSAEFLFELEVFHHLFARTAGRQNFGVKSVGAAFTDETSVWRLLNLGNSLWSFPSPVVFCSFSIYSSRFLLFHSQILPLPVWMCRSTAGRSLSLGKKQRPTLVKYMGAAEDDLRRWYGQKKGVHQAALDSILFPKSFSLRFNLDGRLGVGLSERHECYMLVHSVWGPGWCNILNVGLHAPIAFSTCCSKSKKLYDPRCLQHRRHAQTIRQHAKIDDNAFCNWHLWV